MIHTISNKILTVSIDTKGAELQSIVHNETGLEYMWGAGPEWAKKSPVLFPIVGGLKDNTYSYNGNTYTLGRHGFAREMEFTVTATHDYYDVIMFTLADDEDTLKNYPFKFSFSVGYRLVDNSLHVTYTVKNTDDKALLFSVGAHPAFKVPLTGDTVFTDYYLQFSHIENAGRWPLSAGGQIEKHTTPVLDNTDILPLTKALFYKDALVFKHLASNAIAIKSDKTPHGLKVVFDGFPYMGIWNAKDANFVCIEPWCGIADSVDTTGNLAEKEGINTLAPGDSFERTWSVELF